MRKNKNFSQNFSENNNESIQPVNQDRTLPAPKNPGSIQPKLTPKNKKKKKLSSNDIDEVKKTLKHQIKKKPSPQHKQYYVLRFILDLFKKSFFLALSFGLIAGIFLSGIGVGILFGFVSTTEPIPAEVLSSTSMTQTSEIYNAEKQLTAKLLGIQNIDRKYIEYSAVKDTHLLNAFISIEDERFMSHIGVDPKRIASAVIGAVLNGGEPTHGASTITQQTVKLITGKNQKSAQRKIQEWFTAIMLNNSMTKEEIFELYINRIPLGNSYVGVQSAAQGYFGKDASELDLSEVALLASIPKGPSLYNPRTEKGIRNVLRRQRVVLMKMYELGYISKDEYTQALNTDLVFTKSAVEKVAVSNFSYFDEYVLKQAVKTITNSWGEYKDNPQLAAAALTNKGVRIYTTQDPKVQEVVDRITRDKSFLQQKPERFVDTLYTPQTAVVVIDNRTNAVVAMAGSAEEKREAFGWNRATDGRRPPGSSIKPLIAYAPAIDTGLFSLGSVVEDKEVFLNGKEKPWPLNYTREHYGLLTLRNAIRRSLNVPAVLTLKAIGVDVGKAYLKNFGIDWTEDEVQLAAALGAASYGVTPLEMAQAFATFANKGVFKEAYVFDRIEDSNGAPLLESKPAERQVISPETSYIMTTGLMEAVTTANTSSFGWGADSTKVGKIITNANGEAIENAGKTGTTDEDRDKWFVGYTPYYTIAVWYGFDNLYTTTSIYKEDFDAAVNIYKAIATEIHQDLPGASFEKPADIVEKRINIHDGLLSEEGGSNTMSEWYPKNSPLIPKDVSTKDATKYRDQIINEDGFLDWDKLKKAEDDDLDIFGNPRNSPFSFSELMKGLGR